MSAPLPKPFHHERAKRALEGLSIKENDLLYTTFSHSAYLTRLAEQEKDFLGVLLKEAPDAALEKILADTLAAGTNENREEVMQLLRQQKKRAALLIALADIGGVWSVEQVMEGNTRFADACLEATIQHLLLSDPEIKNEGLFVLAMGKYGARELNYSSDIDIILFYDSENLDNAAEAKKRYTRLTQELVRMLQEMTADGYVFRVDLSLRPDPGTTQAAISITAAHAYYETVGQNWERAAYIKARLAAGDRERGQQFLEEMKDFIWRKYLDYAVLQDIHAMKRQAHAAIGWDEKEEALNDRDIKRAAGGIRDIEMFVQSQQLIAGGRDKLLRRRPTCVMLGRLAARKWISKETTQELIAAYRFFRMVEHRLQMIADEQTHKLPSSQEAWQQLALFCGFDDEQTFQAELHRLMEQVREHYGELFRDAPTLSTEAGALVFTGGEDDPETLQTLEKLGFNDPAFIASSIRSWHRGRIPAATSARVRELLTELVPKFLTALAKTDDKHAAFLRLDRFLSKLHSAVQFFSLLLSNPKLIERIVVICGTAPRLAEDLAKKPEMIEALFLPLPDDLLEDLTLLLSRTENYEDVLNEVRVWLAEQHFHLATEILDSKLQGLEAAKEFSNQAEIAVMVMQQHAAKEFNQRKKSIPKGEMAVLAAGSLGAREMTVISDLDLIFIYEGEDDRAYWIGLAQHFVGALTTQTARGGLFDVDMRLRPSGKAGPVAVSLEQFVAYQKKDAWVWEHMALTRMRPLSGTPAFQKKIASAISAILQQPREQGNLKEEVRAMRTRLAEARPPKGEWDVSASQGGLVDVEFICQYLQLAYGAAHPEVLHYNTLEAFDRMGEAKISESGDLKVLYEAEVFYKKLVQLLHLSVGRIGKAEEIPEPLQKLLLQTTQTKDFQALQAQREQYYEAVRELFQKIIGI